MLEPKFDFPGLGPKQRSYCDLAIYDALTHPVVVATERESNPGASITNAAEQLAMAVIERFALLEPQEVIWVERYRPGRPDESLSRIFFSWQDRKASSVSWQPLSNDELRDLILEPENEARRLLASRFCA